MVIWKWKTIVVEIESSFQLFYHVNRLPDYEFNDYNF